ncbi:MTH865 family protein [Halomarina ordinaria]|uniref:MTH865 family protein n=1 Tax=Halomarina ordinaria TaxID=3033939 RepID=A0ABD5U4T7_9EURY|nr:MTH865 family protein [Halomarina sp. PSRA2]
MADKEELRTQMKDAFGGADYPINSPMDLVPALPNGPSTKFESGDFSMTAMELNTKLGGGNFPYESADAFVDDVLQQLEEQGHLDDN